MQTISLVVSGKPVPISRRAILLRPLVLMRWRFVSLLPRPRRLPMTLSPEAVPLGVLRVTSDNFYLFFIVFTSLAATLAFIPRILAATAFLWVQCMNKPSPIVLPAR
jgi:hypothetical protein